MYRRGGGAGRHGFICVASLSDSNESASVRERELPGSRTGAMRASGNETRPIRTLATTAKASIRLQGMHTSGCSRVR